MVYKPQKRWNKAQFHKYTGRFKSFIKHGRIEGSRIPEDAAKKVVLIEFQMIVLPLHSTTSP